ncbi:MAG: iron ABC transporter permease [Acidobacteria bacterium]|nr:iron ABC transporter permease [Acidobacteriota bacterium]
MQQGTTAVLTAPLDAHPVEGRVSIPPRMAVRAQLGWLAVGLVVLAAVTVASLAIGARALTPETVLAALTNPDSNNGDQLVVLSRIPRTVAGLAVGAALALAGAAMQGMTRNPLADPGILGINAGAALAVVGGMFLLGANSVGSYLWFAFPGAAAAAVLVYTVASLGGSGATVAKLALAGAAVSAGCGSFLNALLVGRADSLELFRSWQVGALAGKSWDSITAVLPFMGAGMVLILLRAPLFNALALGDDVARSLGSRPGRGRAVAGIGVVLLCGSATALAGPVAFIGLVIPHVVRALVGGNYAWLLPLSMVLGPALLLGADVLGRVVLPPSEVPAGIICALVGAPVFLYLIRHGKKVAL